MEGRDWRLTAEVAQASDMPTVACATMVVKMACCNMEHPAYTALATRKTNAANICTYVRTYVCAYIRMCTCVRYVSGHSGHVSTAQPWTEQQLCYTYVALCVTIM